MIVSLDQQGERRSHPLLIHRHGYLPYRAPFLGGTHPTTRWQQPTPTPAPPTLHQVGVSWHPTFCLIFLFFNRRLVYERARLPRHDLQISVRREERHARRIRPHGHLVPRLVTLTAPLRRYACLLDYMHGHHGTMPSPQTVRVGFESAHSVQRARVGRVEAQECDNPQRRRLRHRNRSGGLRLRLRLRSVDLVGTLRDPFKDGDEGLGGMDGEVDETGHEGRPVRSMGPGGRKEGRVARVGWVPRG